MRFVVNEGGLTVAPPVSIDFKNNNYNFNYLSFIYDEMIHHQKVFDNVSW